MEKKEKEQNKRHDTIQIIIKGIRSCLSNETVAIKYKGNITQFKGYALDVFSKIRQSQDFTDNSFKTKLTYEYIIKKYITRTKGLIFFSHDFDFLVKTIKKREKDFLIRILNEYKDYLDCNKDTLLSKIYGCFRLENEEIGCRYVVIMNNVFPYKDELDEIYDLKGSTYSRFSIMRSDSTLKDQDWLERERKIVLGGKNNALRSQIEKDTDFLYKNHIMDYSLVIGINRSDEKRKSDEIFAIYQDKNGMAEEIQYEKTIKKATSQDIEKINEFVSNSSIGDWEETYFIGIIDILTWWSLSKRIESLIGTCFCKTNISCINPKDYRKRFLSMLDKNIFVENK